MNIFEIDGRLDEEVEELIAIQELVDGIEAGEITEIPEDQIDMLLTEMTKAFSNDGGMDTLITFGDLEDLDNAFNLLNKLLTYKVQVLGEIEGNLFDKVDSYSYHVKQLQADAEMAKDEAARFGDKAKSAVKKATKRKEILIYILNKYGEEGKSGNRKVKTDKFNLWTTNRKSVNVDKAVLDKDDDAHYTTISVKVKTRQALAIKAAINEWAAETSINLEGLDNSTVEERIELTSISLNLKEEVNVDKKSIGARLKADEVIKGAELVGSTSVTIK